jgi:tyrosine-protein kinase Etk/Wzc
MLLNESPNSGRGWLKLPGAMVRVDEAAQLYRRLAIRLHSDLTSPEPRSVFLVAATDVSLPAHASLNLAWAMAGQSSKSVLLIDAAEDCEITQILDCNGAKGFSDVLFDGVPPEDVVIPTSQQNLSFMPAGNAPPQMAEAGCAQRILSSMLSTFDFVILSGGMALRDSLVLILAPVVGCVLLLAADNTTRQKDLEAATRVLGACRAAKVGLVIAESAKR